MSNTKLDAAMQDAMNQVLASPETHARLMRASSALFAVSSIDDPHPVKAVGHMLGSAVEYALNIGLRREFIVEFVNKIADTLNGPDGDKLREAAARHQG